MTNSASYDATGKYSNEAAFGDTTGWQVGSSSHARCGVRFITDCYCDGGLTRKLLSRHIRSPANCHIPIGFTRKHGESSWVARRVLMEIGFFDEVSWTKAISTYFALRHLIIHFSDNIVKEDSSSKTVQGLNRLLKYSRLQIMLIDTQQTVYRVAHHG